jgi:NAD(P)-dependent dehydrogenase (short-subunit alcohol dehydrogenase family)
MSENVVITGGARGLGLFLVEQYLRRGARVFALNRGGETPPGLAAMGAGGLRVLACDVTQEAQVRGAAQEVAKAAGSVDLLVNNAAIYQEKPFTESNEFDADVARRTFDVNAVGPLLVTKHFLPLVLAGKGKTIVNVSSEAGSISTCWRDREYAYCMSKAALNMQSAILQNRVKPQGVKVLAIHPGWMRTEMGGPDAELDPAETARVLVATIDANRALERPIYIDYRGQPMSW